MKRLFSIILICILCAVCLCGCKDKEPEPETTQEQTTKKENDSALFGTWEEYDIPDGQELGDYWVFNSDGTGKWGLMDVAFTFSTESGVITVDCDEGWGEYKFHYSIDGNILTMQEEGNSANQYQKR
ncbi:MAG: hypothetical protein IKZ95_02965 [Lachnospiraceae bacterium]|nr:hypothetical protein [Lachnospiraceae bacterium]